MRLVLILTAIVASVAASGASISDMIITHIPRVEPTTVKPDSWMCVTENITQYIDGPRPTGRLKEALISYGDILIKDCSTLTATPDATTLPYCPFPEKSLWCSFTNFAPSTVLTDYSSYGSSAFSWWAEKRSGAERVATECPITWNDMMYRVAGAEGFFENVVVAAGCYADAKSTSGSSTSKSQPTPSNASARSGPSQTLAPSPTSTKASNGALSRRQEVEILACAGIFAAAAANILR